MVWTLIEPGVAIVASSLVTIRPLLNALRVKGFISSDTSSGVPYHNQPRSTGGLRARAPGGMPGFGRSDLRLSDIETLAMPPSPPPKSNMDGGVYALNNSDVSLQMPPLAVNGAVLSGREVQVDEVPLTRHRG
jgi:hypothetical protein